MGYSSLQTWLPQNLTINGQSISALEEESSSDDDGSSDDSDESGGSNDSKHEQVTSPQNELPPPIQPIAPPTQTQPKKSGPISHDGQFL